jgi:hypothetical protein
MMNCLDRFSSMISLSAGLGLALQQLPFTAGLHLVFTLAAELRRKRPAKMIAKTIAMGKINLLMLLVSNL